MTTFLTAFLSIVFSIAAQFALKRGMSHVREQPAIDAHASTTLLATVLDPWVLGGFLLYGVGALVWLRVLASWDVSKAYPLVGIGFAATVAIGAASGEQVGLLRAGGALLIVAGVLCIARS